MLQYNGAQWYEHFLHICRLCRTLVLLALALSSERLCIFGLHGAAYIKNVFVTFFALPFIELSLVRLALDMVN